MEKHQWVCFVRDKRFYISEYRHFGIKLLLVSFALKYFRWLLSCNMQKTAENFAEARIIHKQLASSLLTNDIRQFT